LGGFWALEWAWHCTETKLRCVRSSGICTPNLNSLAPIVSEFSAFIRTDGRTDGTRRDMARSTRLVILIKNIYTLWGRKRFLLPVTYFSTNLVYPFTLRVTGITNPSACYILSDESSIPFYSTSNGYKNGIKTRKNAIVEYSDYQIPVIQLMVPRGNG